MVEEQGHLLLDQTTLRNLELTATLAGEYDGSLLSTLNRCRTAMGRRLLKTWVLHPLSDREAIQTRHAAVGTLSRSARRLDGMRTSLKGIRDMERLATRWPISGAMLVIWSPPLTRLNACRLSLSGVETVKTRSSHI